MERALAFYRDVLGLRVRADQEEELPEMGGEPARKRRAVYLCFDEGPHASFVVLDQQLTVEPFGEPARLFQTGVHHFAFWVDDLDARVERARSAGLRNRLRSRRRGYENLRRASGWQCPVGLPRRFGWKPRPARPTALGGDGIRDSLRRVLARDTQLSGRPIHFRLWGTLFRCAPTVARRVHGRCRVGRAIASPARLWRGSRVTRVDSRVTLQCSGLKRRRACS